MNKIKKFNIDELVVKQVLEWIETQEYKPGDKLPSENELAKRLGVGRHALREGLGRLIHIGILESKNGVGTFVKSSCNKSLYSAFNPFLLVGDFTKSEIYEVREVIEPFAAKLAALRVDNEDIEKLIKANEEMERELDNYELFVEKNVQFHILLAQFSGNQLLALLLRTFRELIDKSIKKVPVIPGSLRKSVNDHYKIIEMLKEKDGENAAKAMLEHLVEVDQR